MAPSPWLALLALSAVIIVMVWFLLGMPTGRRSRNTVYGLTSTACRREMLDVRREHDRLLDARGNAGYGTAEWDRLTREIHANIARLDEIELRYFGPKER